MLIPRVSIALTESSLTEQGNATVSKLLAPVFFCIFFVGWGAAAFAQERCLVADPSGTPLNVRTVPNGKIVNTLRNGFTVNIIQTATSSEKAWVYIKRADSNIPLGWVFRDYLNCERETGEKRIEGYAFEYRDEPSHTSFSLDDCISSCGAAPNCGAYVFFISKKLCRLMTRSDAVLERNPDAISGYNNSGGATQTNIPVPKEGGSSIGAASRTVIPLKNDSGIFVVPVEINGALTLDFVIDSGASDVSVPADVVSTLIRTKTIGPSDFVGQKTYVMADGSEAPSDVFVVRTLKVGNRVVQNVTARIASQKATLLLGQSFLRHFNSWSIDNARHALVLE